MIHPDPSRLGHAWLMLLFMLTSGTLLSASTPCTLVREGVPQVSIHVGSPTAPAANLAARELQHWIQQITGTRLDVVMHPGLTGVRLASPGTTFEPSAWIRDAGALALERYEYAIRFEEAGVTLIGRDAPTSEGPIIDYAAATDGSGEGERIRIPAMFEDQGTLRATYDFLERFCGVRFYGPRAISLVFPQSRTLTIEPVDIRRSPSIPHVSGSLTWRWPLMDGQYGTPSEDALRLFERRLRLGGIPWYTNHTLHRYPERFPPGERPEFYAEDGGGRLCYSSEALARQVAQDARDYFEGKAVPDLSLPKGSDFFPVVPEDAARFCSCAECRRWLDPYADHVPRTPSGLVVFNDGRASHLWFRFVNRVARELRTTHPDRYISTLAYESYFWYPTAFRLEPNVAIAPCMQVRNYWHGTTYANELGHYSRWVTDGRPVFLWNYYCFPEEPAVIRQWHCFPGFSAHELAKMAKRYARDGVLGTFFCGIGEQVDFYVTLKLYDDATQDVDLLLNEFFRLYFGSAAEPMQAFYTLIETTYSDPANWDQNGGHHQTEAIAWEQLGTATLMDRLQTLMDRAETLAVTPREQARVGLWKRGVWDYMLEGRRAYENKIHPK